jgi:hypothetical protein
MPSWQSIKNPQMILASNELTTEFFLCALLALAQCPLGRASQNSSELLSSSELTTEFLYALPCTCSMPTWQSFTELLRDSVCNCVLLHSLASEVFNNLKVFL